ncbi:hypothetical protein [Pseudomonas sp. MWU15-20650]|uniref:hypothetical protein n=1 Tax=Pseudomonas sp. MWU15-20650 TaxID=2933107 RepID=UPI00200BE101|nr:hypothetical protein [Pseudomonas sp. MWU15-20650]
MVVCEKSSRLLSFIIRRPNKADKANGLYANGNHQCEVLIDIVKQVRAADDTWSVAALTDNERSSVTVVQWSEEDSESLAQGWNCDELKNRFKRGLWSGDSVNECSEESTRELASDPRAETVKRYLRCHFGAAVRSVKCMARVVIDGEVYTTHCSRGQVVFESSITVNAEHPFSLEVKDLEQYEDTGAFFASRSLTIFLGSVYYWTPPAGLSFVENRGIGDSVPLPGDGEAFDSALSRRLAGGVPGFEYMAGTLTNKNQIGETLKIKEVYQGPGLPDEDAPVRFNEKSTIMRAVRLMSNGFSFPEHYKRRPWHLLDNFGTEHTFTLDGDSAGNLYLLGPSELGSLFLSTFEIMLPGGQTSTDELYSNGRHQCKVEVEVVVMQLRPDGSSLQVPLTSAQRNSLTITVFSNDVNEPLPRGWSCDKDKNIYDVGLRKSGGTVVGKDQGTETEVATGRHERGLEVVNRYLRVDSSASHEKVRFMAAIEVDGVRYTTNYIKDDFNFLSYVTIGSVSPYTLRADELVLYADHNAYDDFFCDIDVYYWTAPSGLRFLVNRGLDSPLFLPWEGKSSTSSYCFGIQDFRTYKGGIVYGKDVPDPRVLISDIFSGHPQGDQKVVKFNQRTTIMRAVRFRENKHRYILVDHQSKWRLWDNFGCEQVYEIVSADFGNLIELKDG